MATATYERRRFGYIEEPALARWLFGSATVSPFWLVLRLWLGYEWFMAGFEKLFGDGRAAWTHGTAIHGFVKSAVAASKSPEHPQVAYGWWVSVLHRVDDHAALVGRAVSWTELIIGALLILGLFTGIAAFVGLLLNFTYVLSGIAGVNPAFMIVGLLLMLAWRNAGWIGLDRFVLPALGTPWHRGRGLRRRRRDEPDDVVVTEPAPEDGS
jgi:thiosulfate dehydrogenase [quinone] large subunit